MRLDTFLLRLSLATTFIFSNIGLATSGPNHDGTLILHHADIVYSTDHEPYCGFSALVACEDANVRVDDGSVAVFYVLAAFFPGTQPRLAGVTFGIEYDGVSLVEWAHCGDFELANPDWPASGSGTAVTWSPAQTDELVEIYWFAGYNYDFPAAREFSVKAHPSQGGWFGDDSIPSQLDRIAGYGTMGFGTDGELVCPIPDDLGVCCVDADCFLLSAAECLDQGGIFLGEGVPCTEDACLAPDCSNHLVTLSELGFEGDLSERPRSVAASVGAGRGTVLDSDEGRGCGALVLNSDGTYENGYAWQYGGVAPGCFGAFAEGYAGEAGTPCSVVFDFTQVGFPVSSLMDVYIWEDVGGNPGGVLALVLDVFPGPIAFWPAVSRHVIPIAAPPVNGDYWVGYWGNWPGLYAGWYVGADLDGFGGLPRTKIAPGTGYPTGWQDVSVVWGPTQALGIGVEIASPGACCIEVECIILTQDECAALGGEYQGDGIPCDPSPCSVVPVRDGTWGEIKRLFR